jgi:hypothetical protein
MVRLGFIRDMGQAPSGAPRVFLHPARGGKVASTLLAGHVPGAPERVELRWEVPPSVDRLGEWTPALAKALADLGLTAFCLDPVSVAETLGRPVEEALTRFGQAFWPHWTREGVVYFLVGAAGRRPVYQAIRAWESALAHVRFDTEEDLERKAEEAARAKAEAPPKSRLARLFPRIFKNGE